MNKVANYDTLDYDYSTYWKKREYEHKSEVLVLKKLLKGIKGKTFLDVGGSYGRVLPCYYDKYDKSIIVDYSLKTLQKNYIHLKKEYPNVELISANAYHLPFKDNIFDGALMIRVLHHIERPKDYFKEIYRVISPTGVYIQEYANKHHLKAIIRGLLTLNSSVLDKSPYQQPDKQNYEGASKNSNVPFLNYHISLIKELLVSTGFEIEKKYGCSFLRLNLLKRFFKTNFLLFWENIFQYTLSWLNISPSIFIKSLVQKKSKRNNGMMLEDLLVCPRCKNTLNIQRNKAICKNCNESFNKKKYIWDFRI